MGHRGGPLGAGETGRRELALQGSPGEDRGWGVIPAGCSTLLSTVFLSPVLSGQRGLLVLLAHLSGQPTLLIRTVRLEKESLPQAAQLLRPRPRL